MIRVRTINRFLLLACAPFIGIMLWLNAEEFTLSLDLARDVPDQRFSIAEETVAMGARVDQAAVDVVQILEDISKFYEAYAKSANEVNQMVSIANAQVGRPALIYDTRITNRLGRAIHHVNTPNIDLKIFELKEANYSGYAMKVHLKTSKAIQMTVGKDKVGETETTLAAAQRNGAIAGINAGGFFSEAGTGKIYPLSTTVINGNYVVPFEPSYDDLTFFGISKDLKLIGGKFGRKEDLDKLNPLFGATFVPMLLKQGVKQPIPTQWATSPARAPRSVVGSYKNDHLLFLVTNGYRHADGNGATLAELQDKLQRLGVLDAYNMDGGGSVSLVYNGRVLNDPSDGRLRNVATSFLFFR